MSSPFARSLRALESERSRGWPAVAAASVARPWAAWFLFARVPLYETSTRRTHRGRRPQRTRSTRGCSGAAFASTWPSVPRVRAGDVLVELEADAERLALQEARARVSGARTRRSTAIRQRDHRRGTGDRGRATRHSRAATSSARVRARGASLAAASPRRTRDGSSVCARGRHRRAGRRTRASRGRPAARGRPRPRHPRWPVSIRTRRPARAIGSCAFSGCGARNPDSRARCATSAAT